MILLFSVATSVNTWPPDVRQLLKEYRDKQVKIPLFCTLASFQLKIILFKDTPKRAQSILWPFFDRDLLELAFSYAIFV